MFVCLCVCSDHLSLSPSSSFTPSLSHLLPPPPPLFPPRAGRQRKRDQRVHLSPHSASHPLRLPQCTAAVDWVIAPSQHTLRTSLSCRLCLPLLFYRHILLICLLLHTFTLHFKFNTGLLLCFVWWSSAHSFTPSPSSPFPAHVIIRPSWCVSATSDSFSAFPSFHSGAQAAVYSLSSFILTGFIIILVSLSSGSLKCIPSVTTEEITSFQLFPLIPTTVCL